MRWIQGLLRGSKLTIHTRSTPGAQVRGPTGAAHADSLSKPCPERDTDAVKQPTRADLKPDPKIWSLLS
ncbi:hypothetical protein DSO57_1038031 [Entomophthora muscae]|uniref:Uncharacterized protein n=1 Tax=Entomophthora muscae TaxID=34485 RepID=A0ACC2SBI1_9FUNG|nr:hypothetical protein DSO57_1038031 [Entomophthora muscae]